MEDGVPFIVRHRDPPASKAFMDIVEKIEKYLEERGRSRNA